MPDASLPKLRLTRSPAYGWVVLAAATLAMMMTLPGRTAAISVFLDPMLAELGISRSFATGLFMAGTLAGACLLPLIGRWFDRVGARVGVTLTVVLFAGACVGMGHISGALGLLAGFFALRVLGQGALLLVAQLSINQWFTRRRGLAMGIAGAGLALANVIFPLAIQSGISTAGWRATYAALGLLLVGLMLPVGALLFRQRPEAYGLAPEGLPTGPLERHWTLGEAVRTSTFWAFALGIFALSSLSTALVFHHYSLMASHGLGRETATLFFVPLGLMTALCNLGFGVMVDRRSPRAVLATALGLLVIALVGAGFVASPAAIVAYGAVLGAAMGGMATVMTTAWAHHFGRSHLGSIKGLAQTLFVVGTAVGPWPFALCFEATGSYQGALSAALALPLVVAALLWRVRILPACDANPPAASVVSFSSTASRV